MRNPSGRQLVAREYRRLSDAKGGTSMERQGDGNATSAAENGWSLGTPYEDDGLSASRYARKKRDDFEKLLADLGSGDTGRSGDFGADVLMLWESSRGSRRVGEWVSFIELCEQKQVLIWVTTHERLYDPRNGRDRKTLLEDAVDSEYESYKTHTRVSSTVALEARKGRPHGRAPDGLMPVYDPKTGDLVTWAEDPKRSEPVKELFRLLEKGHTLAAIEGKFLGAGYTNRSGRPYSREHLRIMALRHAYAGLRFHRGEVHEGIWDGIVPRARFWNVRRILTAPSRKTTRGGRARHELTVGLWCGVCGKPCRVGTVAGQRGRSPDYECKKGCVTVAKKPVDDYIIGTREEPGALMEYLARDDLYQLLAVPGSDEDAVRQIEADLAQAHAELEEMELEKPRTFTEVRLLSEAIDRKKAETEELQEQKDALTLPPAILNMVRPGKDVWDSWEQAPVSARREVVRIVLSPRGLGKVTIVRALRNGPNQPAVERLRWSNTEDS